MVTPDAYILCFSGPEGLVLSSIEARMMMNEAQTTLHYVYDPCGWCYGAAPC